MSLNALYTKVLKMFKKLHMLIKNVVILRQCLLLRLCVTHLVCCTHYNCACVTSLVWYAHKYACGRLILCGVLIIIVPAYDSSCMVCSLVCLCMTHLV